MSDRYRKKPLEITAEQWTGDLDAVTAFAPGDVRIASLWIEGLNCLDVRTAHRSWQIAHLGDWVVRDAKGQLDMCPAVDFDETYEGAVEPDGGVILTSTEDAARETAAGKDGFEAYKQRVLADLPPKKFITFND